MKKRQDMSAKDTCELRIYEGRKRQNKRATVPTSDRCGRGRVGYVDLFKENRRSV